MKIDKHLIHEACLEKQNELLNTFTTRLETMESDVMDHDHSPSQTENRSAEQMELINAVAKELEFAQREMEFLKNLSTSKQCEVVEPGAVVVTDKRTFYICVSIEEFEVGANQLFGMSVKAPLYIAMRGLKKGTSFQYNESEYDIVDVY